MKKYLSLFLFLLLIHIGNISYCYALDPQVSEKPVKDLIELGKPIFKGYTEDDGLPSNNIYSMAFDKKGYLWIGLFDGAAFYDGYKWTRVDLPNNNFQVRRIFVSSDNTIWFSTLGGGLVTLKDKKFTTYNKSLGILPGDKVRCVIESLGANGQPMFWIGTSQGLVKYEDGKWTTFNTKNSGLHNNSINSLIETVEKNGRRTLWIGTQGGLARYEDGKWTTPQNKESDFPTAWIWSMLESTDANGQHTIWMASDGEGLIKYQDGKWITFNKENTGVSINNIYSLEESIDANGQHTIWIASDRGLIKYQDEKWTAFYGKDFSALSGTVNFLLDSKTSNNKHTLWIGTLGNGIAKYQEDQWLAFDTKNSGLPSNTVWSFLQSKTKDNQAKLFLGTTTGLTIYEQGKWTVWTRKDLGVDSDNVSSIVENTDINGHYSLWVATQGGLARYEDGKWTAFNTKNSGLANDMVVALAKSVGANGQFVLWAGTFGGGLARYEDGKWTTFNTKNSPLPSDVVYYLLDTIDSNSQHTLWIATLGGGLARYRNGEWTIFDKKNSPLPDNEVASLLETKSANGQRTLWVGTYGNGLVYFDPDSTNKKWSFLSASTNPQLPNNTINSIVSDSKGRIYLSTLKGVVRLTRKVASESDPTEFQIYTFTKEDGLPNNGTISKASMVDDKGRIWVGTYGGVAILDPNKFTDDIYSKPLLIARTIVNGTDYLKDKNQENNKDKFTKLETDSLNGEVLTYNQKNILFQYILLSYFKEKETLYQTQLVGYEQKPSAWASDIKQNYTNLSAGSYTFKVWGKDYAGNISGPVEVSFEIKVAPWFTWWAYLFYLMFLGALIYGFVQFRLQSLQQKNLVLEAKIKERTSLIAEQNQQLIISEKKALEANRAKSTFLANMSHELRTPLNAILGFVQLMERTPNRIRSDKEKLAIIMRSGEHLLGLINDVLSISKIEAGQIVLNKQSFNLLRFLDDIEEMFRFRAEAKNLKFEISYNSKLPEFVMGDEGRLRQILINLLGNAFKFTDSGTISLKIKYEGQKAFFEVQDTGQGIDQAELGKLFQPFTQTQSGLNTKEGTGLGLTISKNLIQLMNGEINVESVLGKGSKFSFYVELIPAEALEEITSKQKVVSLVPGQTDYKLLVVDDVEENRVFLSELLSNVGFKVKQASNGIEAVQIWQQWQPHLIWMDMRMPLMDGNEATVLIREKEREKQDSNNSTKTVIIALTASTLENDKKSIIANGCDDFVAKPFKINVIFEKLAQKLGVEFIFEEDKSDLEISRKASEITALTSSSLLSLPPELLAELTSSITKGDIEASKKVTEQIREYNSDIAQNLETMIKNYQFDEILGLVEKNW